MSEPERASAAATAKAARESRRPSGAVLAPIAVFAVLAGIFLIQLLRGGDPNAVPSALIGQPAPAFDLAPLEGLAGAGLPVPGFASADLLGQVTVVNVWASWCIPCRAEHPFITRLGEDERIRVVGINHTDRTAAALAFLAAGGNPYDAVGVDPRGRTAIDWGVYGVPETFLVDRAGIIRHKIIGPIHAGNFETEVLPAIERLIAEPPPA